MEEEVVVEVVIAVAWVLEAWRQSYVMEAVSLPFPYQLRLN